MSVCAVRCMKFRFDFLGLTLFISSLLVLTFSRHELLFVTAFITSLISLTLWLADDWIYFLFTRLASFRLSPSDHHFVATRSVSRTVLGQGFFLKRSCHPLRAHQRWLKTRSGRGIRYVMRHRSAF